MRRPGRKRGVPSSGGANSIARSMRNTLLFVVVLLAGLFVWRAFATDA
jgi:hypothetical protein